MGHEFIHVSQFAYLESIDKLFMANDPVFLDMMDFHAYNYDGAVLGKTYMAPLFSSDEIQGFRNSFPDYFYKLGWNNFDWTSSYRFSYPF